MTQLLSLYRNKRKETRKNKIISTADDMVSHGIAWSRITILHGLITQRQADATCATLVTP